MNWIHIVSYHYIVEEILFLTKKKNHKKKKKNSTQFVFAWYSIVSCNLFAKCKTKDIDFETF